MTTFEIEVGGFGKCDRLGQALQQPGDGDLVDHLGELACAGSADAVHRARVARNQRLGALERLLVAADHHRQRAVLGPGLAARYRRVKKGDAARTAAAALSSRATSAEAVV